MLHLTTSDLNLNATNLLVNDFINTLTTENTTRTLYLRPSAQMANNRERSRGISW